MPILCAMRPSHRGDMFEFQYCNYNFQFLRCLASPLISISLLYEFLILIIPVRLILKAQGFLQSPPPGKNPQFTILPGSSFFFCPVLGNFKLLKDFEHIQCLQVYKPFQRKLDFIYGLLPQDQRVGDFWAWVISLHT